MKTQDAELTGADLQKALLTPSSVFDTPQEVLDSNLPKSKKIEILKRWELDARALQRATEENMSGGENSPLDAINDALTAIDPKGKTPDNFSKAPTKL